MTREELRAAVIRQASARLPGRTENEVAELSDRAAEYFCGATGRRSVPTGAYYLWIDMTVRLGGIDSDGNERVTSIKRGDTTVQFSDSAVAEAMSDIAGRVLQYRVVRAR